MSKPTATKTVLGIAMSTTERERMRKAANAVNRPLSQWARLTLLGALASKGKK